MPWSDCPVCEGSDEALPLGDGFFGPCPVCAEIDRLEADKATLVDVLREIRVKIDPRLTWEDTWRPHELIDRALAGVGA